MKRRKKNLTFRNQSIKKVQKKTGNKTGVQCQKNLFHD